ncbi:DUF1735 domain-containing protein [Pseudoflavitalea sp. G-6-1-2]|uniref:BT_3987 domain-containing protein n=1 Tax=Pseudoflavitalea sp. G-6-1-2 TaxID=2728841 RepID=UPI00146AEDFB|nr:DUF1735 domain-containing protein [Pseudoflavitalea sp. G-6-1-2]NML22705.1 DUF1735 domain-containing protein [Pseudoflavitalea sp. G-6-1-2]
MNATYKFLTFCAAGLVMLGATGCLKDKAYDNHLENIKVDKNEKVVEVMGPITGGYGQVLNFSHGDTTVLLVTVNLAADQVSSEDIKVTMALDPKVITDYNARNGTSLTPLPGANFNIPTFEMTIPKGSREATLKGKIINTSFLETGKYGIGLKIASTSAAGVKVSGNYGTQVIELRVKNKYHGLYVAKGVFHHPINGDRPIDEEKELITVEPNSVEANLGDLGASNYKMILKVNETTNKVTITKSGASPEIIYDVYTTSNTYDPATRTFHLKYHYVGGGGPRIIEEDIKFKSAL